jgi:plastocyanin
MRLTRFALPLALFMALVYAAPAAAFDWTTDVVDFEFKPDERKVAVGDSVTWTFTAEGHTTVSDRGQPDRWRSIGEGANAQGSSFTHVFDTPGRFQYYCVQHKDFMKGVVQVGTDPVADSIDAFKSKRTGKRVKISFKLNEAARVTYKLKGPSKRTVKRARLEAGRHSFTVKRLKAGKYRGVLTVVDDFDKKRTPRNAFVIR